MIELIVVMAIVLFCATYWGARLFPTQWRQLRTNLGFTPKMATPSNTACGACKACKGGGCH